MSEGNRSAIDWTLTIAPEEPSLLIDDYRRLKQLMELSSLLHLCLDRIVVNASLDKIDSLNPVMHLLVYKGVPDNVRRMFLKRLGSTVPVFATEHEKQIALSMGIIDLLSYDDLVLTMRIVYDDGYVEIRKYRELHPDVDASKLCQAEDLNEVNHHAYEHGLPCVPYVDNPFITLRYGKATINSEQDIDETTISGYVVDLVSPVRYSSEWLINANSDYK